MRARLAGIAALLFLASANATAAEMAYNENFVVTAAERAIANEVLAKAEQFRREVAEEWLGEELPPSIGRVMIDVQIADGDEGKTWAIDQPDRNFHMVWLNTSRERALGSMLKHEMTHVVLATEMPGRLPAWANEGAASLADDSERIGIRRRTIAWFARTGNWPSLERILDAPNITADDKASYSVSASVAEFLLTRGDKQEFLRFAVDGKSNGWPSSLLNHYGINGVRELEQQWRDWASDESTKTLRVSRADSRSATPQQ
jgi:hypothetical protein